jgi:hypothetical protein
LVILFHPLQNFRTLLRQSVKLILVKQAVSGFFAIAPVLSAVRFHHAPQIGHGGFCIREKLRVGFPIFHNFSLLSNPPPQGERTAGAKNVTVVPFLRSENVVFLLHRFTPTNKRQHEFGTNVVFAFD